MVMHVAKLKWQRQFVEYYAVALVQKLIGLMQMLRC